MIMLKSKTLLWEVCYIGTVLYVKNYRGTYISAPLVADIEALT